MMDKRLDGTPVSLADMLKSRSRRAQHQRELCAKGCRSLLSMTMVIPGNMKQFSLARAAAEAGVEELRRMFGDAVLEEQVVHPDTGSEALFRLDLPPETVKKKTIELEELHPLGRLFDVDVLGPDGQAVSRTQLGCPPRPCLLCGRNAKECARSRAHSMEELQAHVVGMMDRYVRDEYARIYAACATRALLYEVSATPKPGLVDRVHSGSHRDMDFFTFLNSSAALAPWFQMFFRAGWDENGSTIPQLFHRLRWLGKQAEREMFLATGGVNTHKGLIFALGVLCGALGRECAGTYGPVSLKAVCQTCAQLGRCSLEDFQEEPQGDITHGVSCYRAYQISGARGNVASGFQSAVEIGLPCLRYWSGKGLSVNDISVITLLTLIAETEDTNMIHRGGIGCARACRKRARELLCVLDEHNFEKILKELDLEYIDRNLSPGGCADVLAISLMFWVMEQEGKIIRP